ncbi:MAG: ATP-binding protein [Bacteroidetes bacterium]|nr:MAG: ATP-binding protein [Bacteroidota bacterium]
MKLKAAQLRRTYKPETLPLPEKEQKGAPKAIIGQERAVKALQFGLGNKSQGFNVYVAGVPGTGKQTAVRHFLKEIAGQENPPGDWCYVNNFADPYQPCRLSLPKGMAPVFRSDVYQFVNNSWAALLRVFESEEYGNKRETILQKLRDDEAVILGTLGKKAFDNKFIIQRTPLELIAVPEVEGRPMTDKEFMALDEAKQEKILEQQDAFKEELRVAARQMKELEQGTDRQMYELEQNVALATLDDQLHPVAGKYTAESGAHRFLEDMKADILAHLPEFLQLKPDDKPDEPAGSTVQRIHRGRAIPRRYEVNVFVDNTNTEGAPIILELNPTYTNLFGKIEKESVMGNWVTDFTLIRSGALHASNGGYLILPVIEVLRNPLSWDSLKRALRNEEIVIEEPGEQLGFLTTKSLKPEPVPLKVQIILIGSPMLYFLLYKYDEDFRELFKVKADFDTEMDNTPGNVADFCRFIQHVCREEKLLLPDQAGMARLLEYSHRKAEDQDKLSIRFGAIIDLVKEADQYAREDKAKAIGQVHMQRAVSEQLHRSDLWQEKVQEMLEKEILFIDVTGAETGQVNGISVIGLGDVSFGRPTRITASVSAGRGGIIDLEREAKLGGPIHTKGVLILSGYLAELFGQDKVISLSAQLVFEQSYSEVEGDSASSAELYALLSGLSGLPIRQDIGVTGSVNQKGEIQAVGGINEKIEGFFDTCNLNGLTGDQGVMIPFSNLKNLMVKDEVLKAVRTGKFHIWAIRTIEEGVELLTGVPAGKQPDNTRLRFEPDSVFDRVNKRLIEFADILQESALPRLNTRRRRSYPRKAVV